MKRFAPALVLMFALVVAGRASGQQDDPELTARTHFAAGKYQEALDIFARLYATTLHPTYLRNIGRCYQNMGQPDEAISAFREYVRKAPNLAPSQHAEIDRYVAEMEALKRQRQGTAAASVAQRAVDDSRRVEPAAKAAPTTAEASLEAGPPAKAVVSLAAIPPMAAEDKPAPLYKRWWFWTSIAVVAAGGVATALVLSSAPKDPRAATTFGTMSEQPR